MPTKGPSMRYGNTNGAHHRGEATQNINYPWAKDFNKNRLKKHFKDHGGDFGANTKEEYAAKAVHFANEVDRKNYKTSGLNFFGFCGDLERSMSKKVEVVSRDINELPTSYAEVIKKEQICIIER